MKKILAISLCLLLVASFAMAKNVVKKEPVRIDRAETTNPLADTKLVPQRAAAADTFWLADYTFDSGPNCVSEGYTTADITAQVDDFFHVDTDPDPGAISGAGMIPEGLQAMWCGARPSSSLILCGYANLPGYGNGWNQALCYDTGSSTCISVSTGEVFINFSTHYDSEGEYDATTLEVDNCDGNWVELYGGINVWDGEGTDTLSIQVSDTLYTDQIGVRFHFEADGAYSDQDFGDFTGVSLDELSVVDSVTTVVPYEDFEKYTAGAATVDTDYWKSCTPPGYGDFAALFQGITVVQEDPCFNNFTCLWGFFQGSTYNYGCGGWPAQAAVPYENERGQYIWNEAWSPAIAVQGTGSLWQMWFDVYGDVPGQALVYYIWHVRSVVEGCPGAWRDYNYVYYAGNPSWGTEYRTKFGQFLAPEPGLTHIQVAHGVIDMCPYWGGGAGDCECHSHGPLQDNVRVFRVNAGGPQWSASRDLDQFQDTFAGGTDTVGRCRVDSANDINTYTDPIAEAGDSAVVIVDDPETGMDYHITGDPSSGPAVYVFLSIDGPSAGVAGTALPGKSEDHDQNIFTYRGTAGPYNGRMWQIVQMDSSFNDPEVRGEWSPSEYCVDLNDNLFVPGDTVYFFAGARSGGGVWTYGRANVAGFAQWDNPEEAALFTDEVTFLPAGGPSRGGDILYVDGLHTRGGQPYFDSAFDQMGILDLVDRFDIRAPSSGQANHPGMKVQSVGDQLIGYYKKIVWNTGNLVASFADGTTLTDKSDDTGLCLAFLNQLTSTGGVYLSGDDPAEEWVNTFTSASSTDLKSTYIQFDVASGDQVPTVGIAPYGVGFAGGMFSDAFGPDTVVAYGGCPGINDFDVLTAPGGATGSEVVMEYHGNGTTGGAIVADHTVNPLTNNVGFVLAGFSFHYIRDAGASGVPARSEHLHRILTWLGNILTDPVGTGSPSVAVNQLDQNYPNPFNPTTTIKYQVKDAGPVSLRIYNVAGQLVRTLVDEQVKAGVVMQAQWQGVNDAGQPVSSGVYFYKLIAKNYTQTKKMVLLK